MKRNFLTDEDGLTLPWRDKMQGPILDEFLMM